MKLFKIVFSLLFGLAFINNSFAQVSGSTCTDLSANVSYKMYNPNVNGSVYLLQNFLYSKNYLSYKPTGYFGVATLNAVKKFQSDNDISTTGLVGPLTRSIIKSVSCGAVTSNAAIFQNATTALPAQVTALPAIVQNSTPAMSLVSVTTQTPVIKLISPKLNDLFPKDRLLIVKYNYNGSLNNFLELKLVDSNGNDTGFKTILHPDIQGETYIDLTYGGSLESGTYKITACVYASKSSIVDYGSKIVCNTDSAHFSLGCTSGLNMYNTGGDVYVCDSSSPASVLNITYPNGGQSFSKFATINIKYEFSDQLSGKKIGVDLLNEDGSLTGVGVVDYINNSRSVALPLNGLISNGKYKIKICTVAEYNENGSEDSSHCDTSNYIFDVSL